MTEEGWFTTGRKLQLKFIAAGLLIALLTYFTTGLLNGFPYANHLITEYPLQVLFYAVALIAFIPFYRRNDELIQKMIHQIGWSGAILLIPAISSFTYYSYNPPTTGIGRITLTISKILVWITIGMVLSTLVFTQRNRSEN